MAIEIVDLPIKHGDFHSYVSLPEGNDSGNRLHNYARYPYTWTIVNGYPLVN